MRWLKHAFAVDPPGPAEPTDDQRPAVDWLCMQIARRHLTTPGIIFLELTQPLNYILAQAAHFFRPGVWAVMPRASYRGYVHLAEYLEQRGAMEYLRSRIEFFESEFERVAREGGSVAQYIQSRRATAPSHPGTASGLDASSIPAPDSHEHEDD